MTSTTASTKPSSMTSVATGQAQTERASPTVDGSKVNVGQEPQPEAGGNPAPDEAKEQKPKTVKKKDRRKGKPGKIHIRLPSIESYQKDLCFPAEAPGRVVVRLERLMGSDKIRPVDGKYMDTLIQRLEEEETAAWDKKIKLRKKAEKERYRQLAIQGLMEPGPGMEDLYDHPIFRVNRILNRLNTMEHRAGMTPPAKMPPIYKSEPFEKDSTGAYFKDYPFHRALRQQWEQYRKPTKKDGSRKDDRSDEEEEQPSERPSSSSVARNSKSEMDQITDAIMDDYEKSLEELQKKYNVPTSPTFEDDWKTYVSPLVEDFSAFSTADDMFQGAKSIFDMYTAQALLVKDHVKTAGKVHAAQIAEEMMNEFLDEAGEMIKEDEELNEEVGELFLDESEDEVEEDLPPQLSDVPEEG